MIVHITLEQMKIDIESDHNASIHYTVGPLS